MQLYYNFNQVTHGSMEEFLDMTLGDVLDVITVYINNNLKKNTSNKNEKSIVKGKKVTYGRAE